MQELSNFYKDFSFKFEHFEVLQDIYVGLFEELTNHFTQVSESYIINKVGAYRTFPIQRVRCDSATYDLVAVLENNAVQKITNTVGLPLQVRIDKWNSGEITLIQKMDSLDFLGFYINLSTLRGLQVEQEARVIDFKINGPDGQRLNYAVDYALRANRMYLLGEVAKPGIEKYLTLTDIFVDYDEPKDLIGARLGIDPDEKFTKNEYTEIVKMLVKAALGGPTLKNIKAAVVGIPGFDKADVYDRFVLDKEKQKKWLDPHLTDFQFIVAFPEEYTSDLDKLNVMIKYLNLIKPAYTKFFVIVGGSIYYDGFKFLLHVNDAYSKDAMVEGFEDRFTRRISDSSYLREPLQRLNSLVLRNNQTRRVQGFVQTTEDFLFENMSDERYNNTIEEELAGKVIMAIEDEAYTLPREEELKETLYYSDSLNSNFSDECSSRAFNIQPRSRFNSSRANNARVARIIDEIHYNY